MSLRALARHLVCAALLATAGCNAHPATEADCAAILDRIVELELRESGFHDAVLIARRQAELRRKLGGELRDCVGRRLPDTALECVRRADSAEAISHRCLR